MSRGKSRAATKKAPTTWKRWILEHQVEAWFLPIALILALNVLAGWPQYRLAPLHPRHLPSIEPTYHLASLPSKFLFLSYLDPITGLCLKGADDFYIVLFWILLWTFMRAIVMRWFWQPIARLCRVTSKSGMERFAEQGWGLLYAVVSWLIGMTILFTSPYKGPLALGPSDELFEGYPHFALTPLTKFYYLIQIAFWSQTIMALQLEKKRKDYWQMFAHHIITFTLLTLSYATNFTRVGNLILCQMDLIDIVLPIAKMFKYADYNTMADIFFGLFLVAWIVTRHIFFPWTVWHVAFCLPKSLQYHFSPEQGHFLSVYVHAVFVVLLCALEVILCAWLLMILKVVQRVLQGQGADDVRSDSEESDDDDDDASSDDKSTRLQSASSKTSAKEEQALSKQALQKSLDAQRVDIDSTSLTGSLRHRGQPPTKDP